MLNSQSGVNVQSASLVTINSPLAFSMPVFKAAFFPLPSEVLMLKLLCCGIISTEASVQWSSINIISNDSVG